MFTVALDRATRDTRDTCATNTSPLLDRPHENGPVADWTLGLPVALQSSSARHAEEMPKREHERRVRSRGVRPGAAGAPAGLEPDALQHRLEAVLHRVEARHAAEVLPRRHGQLALLGPLVHERAEQADHHSLQAVLARVVPRNILWRHARRIQAIHILAVAVQLAVVEEEEGDRGLRPRSVRLRPVPEEPLEPGGARPRRN